MSDLIVAVVVELLKVKKLVFMTMTNKIKIVLLSLLINIIMYCCSQKLYIQFGCSDDDDDDDDDDDLVAPKNCFLFLVSSSISAL